MTKKSEFNLNGYILGEFDSPIDGKPCVAIATGFKDNTQNSKTGNLIQTFFIRRDIEPHTAFKNGEGFSVCGDCPHALYNSPKENGFDKCYVFVGRSVLSVYRAYKKGRYQHLNGDYSKFIGRGLRLGSFGDPSIVPQEIIMSMIENSKFHTGYTHQWRKPFAQFLKGLCMASADGMKDFIDSIENGWQPFQVRKSHEPKPQNAVMCPSSKEANRVSSCEKCKLCDGSRPNLPVSIIAH